VKHYRYAVYAFGGIFVVVGWAILIRTALAGGGATGYLFGALFIALGSGRIYLQRRR
jgi:hypothetical protein